MTLIETAIQRMRGANATSPAETQRLARRQARVPEPVSSEPPRTYLPCTLDSKIMEKSCILPRVSDESALRAYKILRTRLLQTMRSQDMRTLVVTGPDVEQGKTLTAINLAFALAQDPATSVFLVDLDLRRPRRTGGGLRRTRSAWARWSRRRFSGPAPPGLRQTRPGSAPGRGWR